MQENTVVAHNKRLIGIMLAAASLLMIPAVAMLFTGEVKWGPEDFIAGGILLFGTGLLIELAFRKGRNMAYRAGAAVALFTALAIIWINLAVGIIGSENNPANLMYVGVLAVGLIGAGIARFRPGGMARAMFATAAAHVVVALVAQVSGMGFTWVINGVFALIWVGSGLLFRQSAEADLR